MPVDRNASGGTATQERQAIGGQANAAWSRPQLCFNVNLDLQITQATTHQDIVEMQAKVNALVGPLLEQYNNGPGQFST